LYEEEEDGRNGGKEIRIKIWIKIRIKIRITIRITIQKPTRRI